MKKNQIRYPLVREKRFDNKSRKGDYIYVKLKKGEKGSYYKKKRGLVISDYLKAKSYGLTSKRLGAQKTTKTSKEFSKQLKKKSKVEETLKEGYTENRIRDLYKLNVFGQRKAYIDLLKNKSKVGNKRSIVSDKQLREILTLPNNVSKWTKRIEYKIYFKGKSGEELGTSLISHKNISLNKIKKDFEEVIKKGSIVESYLGNKLKEKGYTYSHFKDGELKNIEIRMIFRKAKA